MSTKNNHHCIYLEFPDFGFGPASTSANLIAYLQQSINCKIISTGFALDFVRKIYPQIEYLDVNTTNERELYHITEAVPRNATIISNTNPGFALWASKYGYKVFVVDTLFWMWGLLPDILDKTNSYIVQHYFGDNLTNPSLVNFNISELVYAKPMINFERWERKTVSTTSNDVLIAFGGMGNPYSSTFEREYASWILDTILPIIVNHKNIQKIHIVGGGIDKDLLMQDIYNYSSNLIIHGAISPNDYQRLVTSSKLHFITPGLTSIYESVVAGIAPLFLPGSNVSQIIQSVHLKKFTDYNHIIFWSRSNEIFDAVTSVSEEEGMEILVEYIRKIIKNSDNDRRLINNKIHRYLNTFDRSEDLMALSVLSEQWKDLPRIEELLNAYLF
ncbi:MAG: hypothetical protein ACKO11_02330 [Cuspidothrix sp.]